MKQAQDGNGLYRKLGKKIDGLTVRAPWRESFYTILKELYSPEEAEVIVTMPYSLSNLGRIQRTTKIEENKLKTILDKLCKKGLVMDLWMGGEYKYLPAPLVIGIFEFTMMRTGPHLDTKKWAGIFHDYLLGDDSFYKANLSHGEKVMLSRALPHEGTISDTDFVEVLDYEKATSIVESHNKFSIGLCSCRHEKMHVGEKKCNTPMDVCSSFGHSADYLVRNGLAKEVSKTEMLENLARSREMGLVFNADNVQKNVSFICHCCGCCCNMLLGINKFGYANTVVTSNFISESNDTICIGCRKCVQACPIKAIKMVPDDNPQTKKKFKPQIDTSLCLGCGVCGVKCSTGAMKLKKRKKRVFYPETTFERVILQCLEHGTLQNQLFDEMDKMSHKFMRAFLGAFLKLPPVKKALMSDTLRSSFLSTMKGGAKGQKKDWITEV